ncbi:LysR family transcriptional regulator [Psychrobacter aestuarii]|uniref:LysR family transcriptional regulator n=2 Tax=Psychrobacter aestuarii TaxID=556327 RepID=A0ABP3FD97_9GAMM
MVAKYASFTQAAHALDMPLSTLSRRIAHLENQLNVTLLHRDAHRVQLTYEGQLYYQKSTGWFEQLSSTVGCLQQNTQQASGLIRVTAPINLTQSSLAPLFNDFLHTYPDIQLDLRLSNRHLDIEEDAIDVAFRVGEHSHADWVGRALYPIQMIICSAPTLINDHLRAPEDLAALPKVVMYPILPRPLEHIVSGERCAFANTDNVRMWVNDLDVLTQAVIAGVGIGLVPDYIAKPLIAAGKMVHVLPEWRNQPRVCHMLYRHRDHIPHRVRLFIDFILERFDA